MLRLASIIWAVAATTLAGCAVLVVLIVPALSEQDSRLILPAALLGAVLAIPISYLIAKKLNMALKK